MNKSDPKTHCVKGQAKLLDGQPGLGGRGSRRAAMSIGSRMFNRGSEGASPSQTWLLI